MNFSILLLIATFVAISSMNVEEEWYKFMIKYQKMYKTPIHLQRRFEIFKNNIESYDAHNKLFELGKVSYKKGVNKFTDMTEDEFLDYVQGGIQKLNFSNEKAPRIHILEDHVDWREKGAVTPPKDQGICGPAYAHSAIGAIEGQLKIVRGFIANLSVQNFVDCTFEYGNQGCGGGLMSNCFEYAKDFGIESEEMYPLRGPAYPQCLFSKHRSVAKLLGYQKISTGSEKALQAAISTVGPISIGFHATNNLQGYKSGIFDDEHCKTDEINHAALAIGFGSENGLDYYIVKNSFGDDWGENGYFRIVRGKNNTCGIASLASYPVLD